MQSVPRIHAIADLAVIRSHQFDAMLQSPGGVPGLAVHLRDRTATARELMSHAARLRTAGLAAIVNDRADVAAATGSEGIHLPSAGLPIAPIRNLLGPDVLIGRSTHSAQTAEDALEEGADYVFLGPIWETASHPGRTGIGPEVIRQVGGGKVVAIGGIDAERAEICAAAGAWGVAAISAIWNAADPSRVVGNMLLPFTDNA